MIFTSVPGIR